MKNNLLLLTYFLCVITVMISCKSEESPNDENDSTRTEISDASENENNLTEETNLDSSANDNTIIEDKTITKYICPQGDTKGNLNEPGECQACGMELIENPDFKTKLKQ